MKIAVVLAVAVVMMLGQESECILGNVAGGGGLNILATITAAVQSGGMARSTLQALLNIDLDLFNRIWADVDINLNGLVDLNELLNLQVLLAANGVLGAAAGAGGALGVVGDLTGVLGR